MKLASNDADSMIFTRMTSVAKNGIEEEPGEINPPDDPPRADQRELGAKHEQRTGGQRHAKQTKAG